MPLNFKWTNDSKTQQNMSAFFFFFFIPLWSAAVVMRALLISLVIISYVHHSDAFESKFAGKHSVIIQVAHLHTDIWALVRERKQLILYNIVSIMSWQKSILFCMIFFFYFFFRAFSSMHKVLKHYCGSVIELKMNPQWTNEMTFSSLDTDFWHLLDTPLCKFGFIAACGMLILIMCMITASLDLRILIALPKNFF